MPKYPRLTYDAAIDAAAIQLGPTPRGARPLTREFTPQIRADFVGEQLMGFEILDASTIIDPKWLSAFDSGVEWLTLEEAAREAKRKPVTLRAAAADGRIEGAEKRGRDWFIPRHSLWNYLENLAPAGRRPAHPRAPLARRTKKAGAKAGA